MSHDLFGDISPVSVKLDTEHPHTAGVERSLFHKQALLNESLNI